MQFPLGRTSAMIVAILCVCPLRARAAEYTYARIQIPLASLTVPTGLNDSGTAVGWYINATGMHPFVWQNGAFVHTDFAAPGTTFGGAFGINQGGAIVGEAKVNNVSQGYVRQPDGTFSFFSVPNSSAVQANGINEAGTIVGTWQDQTAAKASHGFIRSAAGAITTFDFAPGHTGSVSAVDDAGRILYRQWLEPNLPEQSYLREPDGTSSAIVPDYPGQTENGVGGFNQLGEIVGNVVYLDAAQATKVLAFIRSPEGHFSYVDNPYAPGTTLGTDINNLGQFVGRYGAGLGSIGGFLATPIPEPVGMLGLAGVGIWGALMRRRRN
jgi:hypothetical protein